MDNIETIFKFVLLFSIGGLIIWLDNQDKVKRSHNPEYITEYNLINIKIDDDSEYHIVYSDCKGNIYTDNDLNYNIKVKYLDIYTPKIIKYSFNKNCNYDSIMVILPIKYKIGIFND